MNNAQYKQLTPLEAHQAALDGEQLWFRHRLNLAGDSPWDGPFKLISIDVYGNGGLPYRVLIPEHLQEGLSAITLEGHKWFSEAAIRVPMPDTPPLDTLKKIREILGAGWIAQNFDGGVWHHINKPTLNCVPSGQLTAAKHDYFEVPPEVSHVRGIKSYTDDYKESLLDLDETIELLEGAGQ